VAAALLGNDKQNFKLDGKLGLNMADKLPDVILTPTTKAEAGHDMEISGKDAITQKLVTKDEWKELEESTLKLFDAYQSHAKSCGFIIPDFKLEFGRKRNRSARHP